MFTDILGVALALSGGYIALSAWDKVSPALGAIAFALLVGAAMIVWAGGVETVPVMPPDDWDRPDDDIRL